MSIPRSARPTSGEGTGRPVAASTAARCAGESAGGGAVGGPALAGGAVELREVVHQRGLIDLEAHVPRLGEERARGAVREVVDPAVHGGGEGRLEPRGDHLAPGRDVTDLLGAQGDDDAVEGGSHGVLRGLGEGHGAGRGGTSIEVGGEGERGEHQSVLRGAFAQGVVVTPELVGEGGEVGVGVGEGRLVEEEGPAVLGGPLHHPQGLHEVAAVGGRGHEAQGHRGVQRLGAAKRELERFGGDGDGVHRALS